MEVQPVLDFKKSRKTIIEMLLDRKYEIVHPKEINEDAAELYKIMNFKDSLIIGKNEEEDIHVHFVFEKMGIKTANEIIEKILKNDIKHIILVCKGGYTTFAYQTFLSSCKEHKLDIETFLQDELLFNVTKNITQPQKMELIRDKTLIKLFHQTMSIKRKQGLLILSGDPINKYYHGKPGEMYKVTRRGGQFDYINII